VEEIKKICTENSASNLTFPDFDPYETYLQKENECVDEICSLTFTNLMLT